ncbi:MAG: HNH endonuclease [Phormidium sp.]
MSISQKYPLELQQWYENQIENNRKSLKKNLEVFRQIELKGVSKTAQLSKTDLNRPMDDTTVSRIHTTLKKVLRLDSRVLNTDDILCPELSSSLTWKLFITGQITWTEVYRSRLTSQGVEVIDAYMAKIAQERRDKFLQKFEEDVYKQKSKQIPLRQYIAAEINAAQKQLDTEEYFNPKTIEEAEKRTIMSIARREGQYEFRKSLLEIYNYRCAITECDVPEALEAAHIIPYVETENNHPSNGLLLRADLHTLFDLKLITIEPEKMEVYLASSLRETSYSELHGKPLQLPKDKIYWPKKEALKRRFEQCNW